MIRLFPLLALLLAFGAVPASASGQGRLSEARAYWLSVDRLAWDVPQDSHVRLHFSQDGALQLSENGLAGGESILLERAGRVENELATRFPHLAGMPVFAIDTGDQGRVSDILRGQFALSAVGERVQVTGIQPAAVLDDLYRYDGPLGVTWASGRPTIRVWAPTAQSVQLLLFEDSGPGVEFTRLPMLRDAESGVWSVQGQADWDRIYYLFEVKVYARSTGRIETNRVTDPYSLSLSMDSRRSQVVNLEDPALAPDGWNALQKAVLDAPEDIVLYELHVRDFSRDDSTVPQAIRGTFAAFARQDSAGMQHLGELARAGLTHVHLLPAFDCASIPENPGHQAHPGDLAHHAPDSPEQQAAIGPIRDRDAFNWCYDPYHYTAPEGSYSTRPDGVQRIIEFRQMVAGLNRLGLRVVMDVVYNHTAGRLQEPKSVLDRIVPDYYHRLDSKGNIETSTCCANTATEHYMMEKLMLDSLHTWATAYRVDGFRFDLMGHHSRENIEKARDRLQALTPGTHGVDGRSIYLYGEGWNFGEVADNARFTQATQVNMGRGSGVGTFNDRLRDAVRGGEHDDRGIRHVRSQGIINGLYTDPNGENSASDTQRKQLLVLSDRLRAGLAGSISDFPLTDHEGRQATAGELDYHGQPVGYASDPQESINYIAAHDNETLFDINQYKLPRGTPAADRLRVQNLGNSIVALSQGVPFFHAGQELLRSKSLDRNSFNSGDWFNLLDYSYTVNGWGRGLPPLWDNEENWPVARGMLADPTMVVMPEHIQSAALHVREMLRIRRSSGLFRLRTGAEVIKRLRFHNTGPDQVPGLVVMSLAGDQGIEIVVLINADIQAHRFSPLIDEGAVFELHPVQQESNDPVVRAAAFDAEDGRFSVPGRTAAVFVRSSDAH